MGSITIRNLDDGLKGQLRLRAARNGHSMEEEARIILRQTLTETALPEQDLATLMRGAFAPLGGLDLPEIPRTPLRDPPEW